MNKTKRKSILICGILALILIFAVLITSKMREGQEEKQGKREVLTGLDVSWMFDKEERRRMEESRWYDNMKYEKEVYGTHFITYKELKEKVEKDGKMVGTALELGGDDFSGGSWLKFTDAKYKDANGNPRIFFVAKKPITNNVSWEELFNAGVVYGPDKINPDGSVKEDATEIDPSYKGKIIKIKKGKYMVRLMRGVSNNSDNLRYKSGFTNYVKSNAMGSEWNRSIVPAVSEYRGSNDFLEKDLQWSDGKKTYLHDWFSDLTLGASEPCDTGGYFKDSVGFKGQYSWCQENYDESSHFLRGGSLRDEGAAFITYKNFDEKDDSLGWRPVLEFIGGKPFVDNKFDY